MNRLTRARVAVSPLALALLVFAAPAVAAKPDLAVAGRHYDRRQTLAASDSVAGDPAQEAAIAGLRAAAPALVVDRNARTGAVRSAGNLGGYLSGPRQGGDIETLALDFVRQELDLLGLDRSDLDDYEVTNVVPSRATGLTHIYLRQRFAGIPVYNGQLQVNLKGDGRVLSIHNQFLPHLATAVNATESAISIPEAVASLIAHLGVDPADLVDHSATARLMYLPIRAGEARLVWNFQVETADSDHWYDVTVDAVDGRVWTRIDWVAADTYKVYGIPVESPNHTSPLPPADGRTSQVNPANAAASPFGWHDTNGVAGAESTLSIGNNVEAYTDTDADNVPDPGSSPDGTATLNFTFPLDLTLAPSGYRPGAVTNLFYWNNVEHDVLYQYGFDEAAGNFQVNNYGNGGLGNDSVRAEAQDGSATNNGSFATPADGARPRMQMYLWTAPIPARDGDLDNGIILHEYGHGVSNRLTGGPANVSCLGNSEQMGEGWSDWMTVYFTALASHTATTNRGIGTYVLNQPINGVGIRPAPYTTSLAVNSSSYAQLPAAVIPHGVGFLWNTMLWEMYWALVGAHGFDADLYNGIGGNNLAMQLVIDGMKLQPCSPGFVDGRNAILAADTALTGGANQCLIWGAFAKRGLGASALQGSSNSNADGTPAFDLPTSCTFVNAGTAARVCATAGTHVQNLTVGPSYTSPPVDMSVTGNPAGSTTLWSADPVPTVPASITLTVGNLGAVAAGSYTLTVSGDDGVATSSDAFNLTVDAAAPAAPALTLPLNSSTVPTLRPTLQWSAIPGASGYILEIDNNSDFSSLTYTSSVAGTSHVPTSNLPSNVHLYWRVRATNGCGASANSPVFNFAAAAPLSFCRTPALAIPDSTPAGVNDALVIAQPGTVADVDVQLVVTHTWVGDLKFTLSNGGPPIAFYDRPGFTGTGSGCPGDDINATVNDEGTDGTVESQCANLPATFGNHIGGDPASASLLSAFDGQPVNGIWTLNASDNAPGDTGSITLWCLRFPNSMPFLDGFESTDTLRWSTTVP